MILKVLKSFFLSERSIAKILFRMFIPQENFKIFFDR